MVGVTIIIVTIILWWVRHFDVLCEVTLSQPQFAYAVL